MADLQNFFTDTPIDLHNKERLDSVSGNFGTRLASYNCEAQGEKTSS